MAKMKRTVTTVNEVDGVEATVYNLNGTQLKWLLEGKTVNFHSGGELLVPRDSIRLSDNAQRQHSHLIKKI